MKIGFVRDGRLGLCLYADISVTDRSGDLVTQKALIDTGFNGYLSLPLDVVEELDLTSIGGNAVELTNASEEDVPLFRGEVIFGPKVMTIPVHGIGTESTIGTSLFRSARLSIEFEEGGDVSVKDIR